MKFFLKKRTDGKFEPSDEYSEESAAKVPIAALVKCEYVSSRNYENLQRYMVFIGKLWDNMDEDFQKKFGTKEKFRKSVEYLAGWRISIPRKDGKSIEIADSVSFESVKSEEEFRQIFSMVIDAALEYFPAWTKKDMQNLVYNEILNFI